MRERGDNYRIYHSHPSRGLNPKPSQTDVRLAYYPSAVYFIVDLGAKSLVFAHFASANTRLGNRAIESY